MSARSLTLFSTSLLAVGGAGMMLAPPVAAGDDGSTTQGTAVTVVSPGVVAVELGRTTVSFRNDVVAGGGAVSADVGTLAYVTKGVSAWSVTVVASAMVNDAGTIPYTALGFTPGVLTAGKLRVPAGSRSTFTGTDPQRSAPITVARVAAGKADHWRQTGSLLWLDVPSGQPAGDYRGVLEYTITGG